MANKDVYKTLQELDIPIESRGFDSFTTCPLSLTDLQAIFDAGVKSAEINEQVQKLFVASLEEEYAQLQDDNTWLRDELDLADAAILKYERWLWGLALAVFILLCVTCKLY